MFASSRWFRAGAAPLLLLLLVATGPGAGQGRLPGPAAIPSGPSAPALAPEQRELLDRITADSLRGHVSFLASDLLEGRGTASRGQDIAAEYIAAQFRRAGLEPAGGNGYFQDAGGAPARPPGPAGLPSPGPESRLRNVVGLLRGSDPELKETYVLLTAHYDHLGMRPAGEGDRIFNGANDNGSGTAAMIEIAAALAASGSRPRRSIVFIAFSGEERGLLGSRYYGRNPRFPIERTVAHLNLEQLGRTDSSDGPQGVPSGPSASLTGFDYSDVGPILQAAGERAGIRVYKHPRNSDSFFARSDNQALADLGVPAHTLCVAFVYPDYHGVGDHWEKIDYANMVKVTRAVALGLLALAQDPREPRWNAGNPRAARYLQAWKARRGG